MLLLVLSKASNRSKQVLREVERAAHCQSHLLTFRIEAIAPGDDLAYFLGADHWVDGFRPLPPSEHFPVLIQHTQALLQREAVKSDSKCKRMARRQKPSLISAFSGARMVRCSGLVKEVWVLLTKQSTRC